MPDNTDDISKPDAPVDSEQSLDEFMSRPSPRLVKAISGLQGDIIILGAGGKMGPTLAKAAHNAASKADRDIRIVAVDTFPVKRIMQNLQASGIEAIQSDLLEPGAVESLPDAANVIYMVGMKFGSTANHPLTWAINAFLPGLVARKFRDSRLVVFSTGNVYPLMPTNSNGASEKTPPNPVGEYAQSCLARERIFTYYSEIFHTRICLFRLNYAVEMRYGVLVDIALNVWQQKPVDITMGCVNVIWQADAIERALLCLDHCASPPFVINITGPERVSVRDIATRFGTIMKRLPIIEGTMSDTALLSDAFSSVLLFGKPRLTLDQMMAWIARWVMEGHPTYGKPTHFETRDGKF